MKKEIEIQTVTVGERGQVVIPQEFREDLKIKPKEKIIAVRIGRRIFYETMEDFLTDRLIFALKSGLKDLTWNEIEKQREEIDREVMK